MTKNLSEIESDGRRLPTKDRARLIRRLITTFESENEGDVEQLWLDEAEQSHAPQNSK